MKALRLFGASYEVTPAAIQLHNRSAGQLPLESRKFEVNYMEYQDRWYLQDARVINHYRFLPVDRPLYSTHTFLTTEIINDQIDAFPINESLRLNDAFVESVEILDEKFWEEYNVVPVEDNK